MSLPPSHPEGNQSSRAGRADADPAAMQEAEPASAEVRRFAGARRPPLVTWLLLSLSFLLIAVAILLFQWRKLALQDAQASGSPPPLSAMTTPSERLQAPAADFTLTAADGTQLTLSRLRGKVVLLNFWATWCSPCQAEMADLGALHEQYGKSHDFVVVAIDAGDESAAAVQAFAAKNRLAFSPFVDPGAKVSQGAYGIRALPTSLIIDRSGRIRAQWLGQLSRAEMLALLQPVW